MKSSRKIIQASKQAPWRKKIQSIAVIAAAIALFGLISFLYVDVTARAATAGRAVQELQRSREKLEQEIEDMQSELAKLRSIKVMQTRAEKLGFDQISPGSITFLSVEEYEGRPLAQLAPAPEISFRAAPRLPQIYTQSLFDWFGNLFSSSEGR